MTRINIIIVLSLLMVGTLVGIRQGMQKLPPPYQVTDWGTKYVVNPEKVIEIEKTHKVCVEEVMSRTYLNMFDLRSGINDCSINRDDKTKDDAYYFYTNQQEDGESPFAEYDICMFHFIAPWDFSPEATTPSFRQEVQNCLNLFPSTF